MNPFQYVTLESQQRHQDVGQAQEALQVPRRPHLQQRKGR